MASARCPEAPAHLDDLRDPRLRGPFDDVLTCRGVLNDLLEDDDRDAAVLSSAARLLRPGGVLALDVRDAGRSREKADGAPAQHDRAPATAGGAVTFTRRGVDLREHTFRMRPWTVKQEVRERLGRAGFVDVVTGPGVGGRWDRLFVTAVRRT